MENKQVELRVHVTVSAIGSALQGRHKRLTHARRNGCAAARGSVIKPLAAHQRAEYAG